jgi:uncharacterized cupin superfamily protein
MTSPRPELFNVLDVEREAFPEFDGHRAVLFESPDGRVVSACYWLKGRHSWELPYDDHFFVITGSATVTVDDHEPFEVRPGSYCHLTKGSTVTFDMSDDFHEVSTLVSDQSIDVTSH